MNPPFAVRCDWRKRCDTHWCLMRRRRFAEKCRSTSYGDSSQATNRREQSQADNLMAAIFTKNPEAKVVIHVGHGHVKERTESWSPDFMAMAQRLKAATGRDPLTISQTGCRSPTPGDVIAGRCPGEGDAPNKTSVDLYVGHPAPATGRPSGVAPGCGAETVKPDGSWTSKNASSSAVQSTRRLARWQLTGCCYGPVNDCPCCYRPAAIASMAL